MQCRTSSCIYEVFFLVISINDNKLEMQHLRPLWRRLLTSSPFLLYVSRHVIIVCIDVKFTFELWLHLRVRQPEGISFPQKRVGPFLCEEACLRHPRNMVASSIPHKWHCTFHYCCHSSDSPVT